MKLFSLGGNPPGVSAGIFEATAAVGIAFLAHRFLYGGCAGGEGFFVCGIDVRDVDVEPGREGGIAGAAVREHDDRVVDFHFGVCDFSVGHGEAAEFGNVENFFEQIDHFLRVLGHQVGGDGGVSGGFVVCRHWSYSLAVLDANQLSIIKAGTTNGKIPQSKSLTE